MHAEVMWKPHGKLWKENDDDQSQNGGGKDTWVMA